MRGRVLDAVAAAVAVVLPVLAAAQPGGTLKLNFLNRGKPAAGEKVVVLPSGGGAPIEAGTTDAMGGLTMDVVAGGLQYKLKPGDKVTAYRCKDAEGRGQIVLGGRPEGQKDCDEIGAFVWGAGAQTIRFGGSFLTGTAAKIGAAALGAGVLAATRSGSNGQNGDGGARFNCQQGDGDFLFTRTSGNVADLAPSYRALVRQRIEPAGLRISVSGSAGELLRSYVVSPPQNTFMSGGNAAFGFNLSLSGTCNALNINYTETWAGPSGTNVYTATGQLTPLSQ